MATPTADSESARQGDVGVVTLLTERDDLRSRVFVPWLAIAFLAGLLQRSWRWAVVAGTVSEIACLIAFYARQFGSGLSVTGWLDYIFRGAPPWGLIALPVGVVYGLLGNRYTRTRSAAAGACLSLALVAEPWAWPLYEGFRRGPLIVWIIETAIGVLATGWLLLNGRRVSGLRRGNRTTSLTLNRRHLRKLAHVTVVDESTVATWHGLHGHVSRRPRHRPASVRPHPHGLKTQPLGSSCQTRLQNTPARPVIVTSDVLASSH